MGITPTGKDLQHTVGVSPNHRIAIEFLGGQMFPARPRTIRGQLMIAPDAPVSVTRDDFQSPIGIQRSRWRSLTIEGSRRRQSVPARPTGARSIDSFPGGRDMVITSTRKDLQHAAGVGRNHRVIGIQNIRHPGPATPGTIGARLGVMPGLILAIPCNDFHPPIAIDRDRRVSLKLGAAADLEWHPAIPTGAGARHGFPGGIDRAVIGAHEDFQATIGIDTHHWLTAERVTREEGRPGRPVAARCGLGRMPDIVIGPQNKVL